MIKRWAPRKCDEERWCGQVPVNPQKRGCVSATEPRPDGVVWIGIPNWRLKSATAPPAPESIAPPPVIKSGRSAAAMSSAAAATAAGSAAGRGGVIRTACNQVSPRRTVRYRLAIRCRPGPAGRWSRYRMARRTVQGIRSGVSTVAAHLVIGVSMPMWLLSPEMRPYRLSDAARARRSPASACSRNSLENPRREIGDTRTRTPKTGRNLVRHARIRHGHKSAGGLEAHANRSGPSIRLGRHQGLVEVTRITWQAKHVRHRLSFEPCNDRLPPVHDRHQSPCVPLNREVASSLT